MSFEALASTSTVQGDRRMSDLPVGRSTKMAFLIHPRVVGQESCGSCRRHVEGALGRETPSHGRGRRRLYSFLKAVTNVNRQAGGARSAGALSDSRKRLLIGTKKRNR